MIDLPDCYRILGLSPDASLEDVRQRYSFLEHHLNPRRFHAKPVKKQASAELRRVREAREQLEKSRGIAARHAAFPHRLAGKDELQLWAARTNRDLD